MSTLNWLSWLLTLTILLVDPTVKQNLNRAINQHTTHMKECEAQIKEFASEEAQLRKEYSVAKKNWVSSLSATRMIVLRLIFALQEELQGKKRHIEKKQTEFQSLGIKISQLTKIR